jgi:hypothetical protein
MLETKERNKAMYIEWLSQEEGNRNMAHIGRKYGVTRCRASQIINAQKLINTQ